MDIDNKQKFDKQKEKQNTSAAMCIDIIIQQDKKENK
jgi:hypothetical protein